AGYVLQVIGHYLEGSRVGEVILLKKLFLPTGSFARRLTIISFLVASLLAGGLFAQVMVSRYVYFNLYETIAPGMYRSGQMPSEHLGQLIRRLGIETVVNLCAVPTDESSYTAERQVVRTNQVEFIHLPFLASLYPNREQLNELLDEIEKIEPPFLVHCHGGADRTGMFFVLLALREGKDWDQAMRQLSLLRFGYYSRTRSATITYPLYDFADYADQHNWPKDLEHFRLWLNKADPQR
ncbi:MAG: tyrosine-protein phosphatase, partial [Phycisphaerae bacterium]|nr:tyrosine-protein phosphatase [Phycisphaerae bacterium]